MGTEHMTVSSLSQYFPVSKGLIQLAMEGLIQQAVE